MGFSAISRLMGVCFGLLLFSQASAQTAADTASTTKLYESAKKEGTVIWYVGAPLEPMKAIAADFEKAYPGITVNVVRIVGPQQYQRFMQEVLAKQHVADLLNFSDRPLMQALIDEKHVTSWQIPNADDLPGFAKLGNHAYAPYVTDASIVYNANKVTPEEAKLLASDWKAILDPRFKGRFGVTTLKCGSCYLAVHMFMDPALKSRFGEDFIRKVGEARPTVYADVNVLLDRVVIGEVDIAYWLFESGAIARWRAGAPLRWVHPKPTPLGATVFQAISSYAPHPNAARLFQNWTFSEAGQIAYQKLYGSGPMLRGGVDHREVKQEQWYDPITEAYNPDFARWSAQYDKDMGIWIDAVKAR